MVCWDYSEHCIFWKKPTGISECDCSQAHDCTASHNPKHVLYWQKTCLQLRFKNHIICVGTYCLSLHGHDGPSFSKLLLCYLVMDNTAVSATLVNPYFNSYNHLWNGSRLGVESQICIDCVVVGKTALVALASHTEKCKDKYYTFMRAGGEKGLHNLK